MSVSVQPGEIQRKPFTPGIEIAWLRGGPTTAGPYVFRLKTSFGNHSAAHFHPDDRMATVLSGTIYLGYGDEFDPDKAVLSKLVRGELIDDGQHRSLTDQVRDETAEYFERRERALEKEANSEEKVCAVAAGIGRSRSLMRLRPSPVVCGR